MANHYGNEGLVTIGTGTANVLAELRSWSLDVTQEMVDDTVMGDSWRSNKPILRGWSGSFACLWDETDTNGQMAIRLSGTALTTATVTFRPEGTGTGATTYSGVVTITGQNMTAAYDGLVEATYTFTGNGTLTQTN